MYYCRLQHTLMFHENLLALDDSYFVINQGQKQTKFNSLIIKNKDELDVDELYKFFGPYKLNGLH